MRDSELIARGNLAPYPNIEILKMSFEKAAQNWGPLIDILHIDGAHTRDDVNRDFRLFEPFMKPGGVALFHDTISFHEVGQFFNELDWPKFNINHSSGLGVATKP